MSIPRAQPHTQYLFLFPIVFGINIYGNRLKIESLDRLLIVGSAEALPILCMRSARCEREIYIYIYIYIYIERERERERELVGSDLFIVALKLAEFTLSNSKNSQNWGWVYTFPCQKFALFVSPFTLSVSPFLKGHHCGAGIRNEFTLSVAKDIRPLCSDSLKRREPRDEWSKTKWSNPAQPYLVLPSKN